MGLVFLKSLCYALACSTAYKKYSVTITCARADLREPRFSFRLALLTEFSSELPELSFEQDAMV